MYEIKVSGMTCGGCVNSVTKALKSLDSEAKVNVDLKEQLVKIESAKAKSEILETIEDAGYSVLDVKNA